jgi:Mce-associated membrane protein
MAADKPVDSQRDPAPVDDGDTSIGTDETDEKPTSREEPGCQLAPRAEPTRHRSAIVVTLAMVLALAALAGWLGYRAQQSHEAARQRAVFVQTARQAAVNLTTISYTEVDADIKRIVDASTGRFHDDFQQRAPAFVDVIKHAQSKSVGSITAAGLESISGNQAQVLVALSVKTSIAGAPEQEPRAWRMRISVAKDGDGAKVSDVQFVP